MIVKLNKELSIKKKDEILAWLFGHPDNLKVYAYLNIYNFQNKDTAIEFKLMFGGQ